MVKRKCGCINSFHGFIRYCQMHKESDQSGKCHLNSLTGRVRKDLFIDNVDKKNDKE